MIQSSSRRAPFGIRTTQAAQGHVDPVDVSVLCMYTSFVKTECNGKKQLANLVDFLLVVDPLPIGRVKRVREFSSVEIPLSAALAEARRKGIHIEFSPVIKTRE